jgi:hypothetical protein
MMHPSPPRVVWSVVLAWAASSSSLPNASAAAPPPPPPPPATTATTAAATLAGSLDQSTPKALLRSFFASRGEVDEATLRSLLHAATPVEQKMLDSVVQIELANQRLRAAERERFGASATTTAPSVASSQGVDVDTVEDIDALTEKVEGDRATVSSPMNANITMQLVRVDGRWKLPVAEQVGGAVDPAMAETLGATTRAQVEIIDAVAADVRAGRFASEEQVRQELIRRFAERLASATRPANNPSATQPAGT